MVERERCQKGTGQPKERKRCIELRSLKFSTKRNHVWGKGPRISEKKQSRRAGGERSTNNGILMVQKKEGRGLFTGKKGKKVGDLGRVGE